MRYIHKNKGVCSMETIVDIDDNNIIQNIEVVGGCDGNLKGITALLKGAKAEDVITRMEGIKCGMKSTSCPDQIAQALKQAISQK